MSRILYIGRSGLGKTHLMAHTLQTEMLKNPKKYLLMIVSPTAPLQKLYMPFKGKVYKYFSNINQDVTEELLEVVMKNFKKKKDRKTIIIIIDDLGESNYMKRSTKDNQLNYLIVAALHLGVHMAFLMQRMKQATPSLRDNADQIIGFRMDDKDQRRDFQKAFAGELSDKVFRKITKHAWEKPYGYLRIDRTDLKKGKRYFSKTQPITIKETKF